jgi:hypothetical protein
MNSDWDNVGQKVVRKKIKNKKTMGSLPWHLQLVAYRGIGRDALRLLGVRPGKLRVPEALCEALGRSFAMRLDKLGKGRIEGDAWIPIAGTPKRIKLTMMSWRHSEVAVFGYGRLLSNDSAPDVRVERVYLAMFDDCQDFAGSTMGNVPS